MKRLGTILGLLAALPCFGQSWYQNNAYTTTYINGTRVVQVIPGVTVKICSNISGACVQQPVYLDQGLTTQIIQPFAVDGQGNFGFWIPDGTYSYRILNAQGLQIAAYPFTAGASGGLPQVAFETNTVSNLAQTYLDLDSGSGVVVTNTSGGHVRFDVDASTLNPPTYQTAAANLTLNSGTVTVTLPSVTKGSRLVAYANSLTYNCLGLSGQPYYPTIADSQGNIWTTDASAFSSYIGGNSGSNIIVADATVSAGGSITVTMTQPAPGGAACSSEYLLVTEYANVVGVDAAGVQACSLGCSGTLAPSATAAASNNDLAVVLSETTATSPGATATPGSRAFWDSINTWANIWQFAAQNIGNATTSTITNYTGNFPAAAIILLKSNLNVASTNTVQPGSNYAIPYYGPSTTNYLYPSPLLSDPSGDLKVPRSIGFAIGTVASGATIFAPAQIFHVTGTADIDRMVPPGSDGAGNGGYCDQTGYGCVVTIFADSGFNFVHYTPNLTYSFITSGVATAGEMLTFVYDRTTQFWYPITPLARGTATLVSGTVTVTTPAACTVAASCVYKLSNCGPNASTAIGTPSLGTVTAGTSFVINSLSATNTVVAGDASKVCWQIN